MVERPRHAHPVDSPALMLATEGMVCLRGLLGSLSRASSGSTDVAAAPPSRLLEAAASEVDRQLAAALAAAAADAAEGHRRFGLVLSREQRWDLRLDLGGGCASLGRVVSGAVERLRPLLAEVLTEDAVVCELSCLIADPGAPRQPLHPDTCMGGPGLVTVFIPLQAIDATMGPTMVLPGTHNAEAHAACEADTKSTHPRGRAMLADPARRCFSFVTEGGGDVMAMDSRVLHCGGTNKSPRRRRLIYITFNAPHNKPRGSTYSLLDEYRNRLKLRDAGPRWHDAWRAFARPTIRIDAAAGKETTRR